MEPLQIGALLEGRYRVEAVVRTGSHDVLYRVSDPRFATDWLMREMDVGRVGGSRRAAAVQAFQEEAAALAELRHPGLAQVVDQPRVLGVLAPDGVWVSRDGETKLVDLGLSRHFDPQAMAAVSAPADLAVDVRAAGALLCFMAPGRTPEPEAARPHLPRALGDLIEKALAAGYPDAGELKHDLMAVAEGFAPEASPSAGAVASRRSRARLRPRRSAVKAVARRPPSCSLPARSGCFSSSRDRRRRAPHLP